MTLTLTNVHDAELPVHYRSRPVFGVLVAVAGETTAVLGHEGYADGEHVRTDGTVRSEPAWSSDFEETTRLSPEESLEETYTVPDGLDGGATVRASIWIGDDTIDVLDNARHVALTSGISSSEDDRHARRRSNRV